MGLYIIRQFSNELAYFPVLSHPKAAVDLTMKRKTLFTNPINGIREIIDATNISLKIVFSITK